MSQQNPWKKMMNLKPANGPKPAENPNNNSPINQFIKENNSSPSWVKNNTNSPPQPPWANKGNVQPKPVQSNNQPPWAKNNPNTGNAPSWAKNTQNQPAATNNQPSWMKANPVNTQNSAPSPPWMKSNSSNEAQSNMWKSKQAAEIQRQKKELQEKMRRQEEQQKQRQRIEKEKRIKEEQQNNMKRELEYMAKQQQYSISRQKFEKSEEQRKERERLQEEQRKREEQERRIRQQEQARRLKLQEERRIQQEQERKRLQQQLQRRRLEQNQRLQKQRNQISQIIKPIQSSKVEKPKMDVKKKLTRKKKPQNLESSKISHISSIRGFENHGKSENQPSMPQNFYHKYLRLINEQSQENDYKVKIQIQKSIYQIQLQFKKQCQIELVNLFTSRKVNNRKRKLIFSNSMQIQYGLCEGRKEQEKLEFITDQIQQLRNRFMQYELLTKCVFNLMRKKINLRLRVPLLNLAEYKGVTFLIQYVCHQLVDIIEIEIGLFQEIANEVLIFQKQLELQQDGRSDIRPITKDQLMVKKISVYGEDYYILYLKNDLKSSVKSKKNENSNKNLSQSMHKISQMNDLTFLQYIIGQNNLLPYYQMPIPLNKTLHEQIMKIGSPAMKRIASNINISNAINTVYCSCQGQVNQESFFQLIIENNKQISGMIVNAGGSPTNAPQPLALCYLEKLSAVFFNFSSNMYKQKGKELVQKLKPAVYIQKHEFQLLEFVKNIEKYITEDKQQLVQQCLSLGRRLWEDINHNQSPENFNFMRLKNEISYLLFKQQEQEAIQLIQRVRQDIGKLSLKRIPLDLLTLKIYVAKDMEIPILKLLSELLETLQFYFGDQSIIHAFVYTIIGNYYSKKLQEPQAIRSQKVITFYQHALNIALKQNGQKALEVADIYLSRAEAFLNLNDFIQFQKDIQNALKIYKMHSKSAPKIAQCNLLLGRAKCREGKVNEGLQLMELSSNQFMKMYNYIESLCILFETLPFLQNKQSQLQIKIEKVVEICFTYKSVWAFRRISTLVIDKQLNCYTSLTLQNLQQLFHPLQPDDRTNEEVIIDLQDQIKGFTSFIEIVRWGLSIIAGKLSARREATSQYQKAHSIIGQIFHFYSKSQTISIQLKDSQII